MRRVVIITLAIAAAAIAAAFLMGGDLPPRVATHWSGSSTPDGFVGRDWAWVTVAVPVGLVAIVTMPLVAVASRAPVAGRWVAGVPAGTIAGVATVGLGSLWVQRGLEDASTVALPGWLIPLGLVIGIGVGAEVAVLLPNRNPVLASGPAPAGALRGDIPGGQVLWQGMAASSSALPVLVVLVGLLGLGVSAAASWWLLIVFVAVELLLLANMRFVITVGSAALVVRGMFGWPRLSVPLAQVREARTTTTSFAQWGGWGLRIAGSRTGIVPSHGPAAALHLADGGQVVVSLTDPDELVGVVNALLDRRGQASLADPASPAEA